MKIVLSNVLTLGFLRQLPPLQLSGKTEDRPKDEFIFCASSRGVDEGSWKRRISKARKQRSREEDGKTGGPASGPVLRVTRARCFPGERFLRKNGMETAFFKNGENWGKAFY